MMHYKIKHQHSDEEKQIPLFMKFVSVLNDLLAKKYKKMSCFC